jgi:hypothetical protein
VPGGDRWSKRSVLDRSVAQGMAIDPSDAAAGETSRLHQVQDLGVAEHGGLWQEPQVPENRGAPWLTFTELGPERAAPWPRWPMSL